MERLALIAAAGGLGALCRYGAQYAATVTLGSSIPGTIAVNISGAFVLGLVIAFTDGRFSVPDHTRVVLATGFLGAYTTFSTLMLESVGSLESGHVLAGIANVGLSVALGLIAVYAGLGLGRAL